MRFLHTADWHIGKPLRGRARFEEYAAALDQVARIAVEAKVDAVLVAGDVFDSAAPPPEAERLVYDFLARLLPERIACVMIAGNHDHPRRLGALTRLLEGLRIHVRSQVAPPAQGGVVSVASRDGCEEARIAVLPFVPERITVDALQVLGPEQEWYTEYARRVEQIFGALTAPFTPQTVNLLLAHILISGARVGTGERALHLGDAYGVNAQQIPANVQYVALGHLHRPQEVLAASPTQYSGSLLELDFGEKEQDKRVVLVEARAGRAATVEAVPLSAGRRLRDVEATFDDLRVLAAERSPDYLRVRVKVPGPLPGLAERVRELLPNALDVQLTYERREAAPAPLASGRLSPAELFTRFYEHRNGAAATPELMRLFHEAYEEAAHG